jgi:hypothetical protein
VSSFDFDDVGLRVNQISSEFLAVDGARAGVGLVWKGQPPGLNSLLKEV